MTRSDIAAELRRYTGSGTVTVTELCGFLGQKNTTRVKRKYLQDDPDSQCPVVRAIGGKRYLVTDVAIRLMEDAR